MTAKSILSNKYSFSILILLLLVIIDISLHKGFTRVIIPSEFTNKRIPAILPSCSNMLLNDNKHWAKAINNPEFLDNIKADIGGIEIDVYFDSSKNQFFAYHDSTNVSNVLLSDILSRKSRVLPEPSIWLDFKNLHPFNMQPALAVLTRMRDSFQLKNKFIIESSDAASLSGFCQAGFFTSYYVPYNNPYQAEEPETLLFIDSVASNVKQYPPSALSGYYFQYPLLKKFFPTYPLLIWSDNSTLSAIGYLFKSKVESDSAVRVILTPPR
jgi:hypothetical protein